VAEIQQSVRAITGRRLRSADARVDDLDKSVSFVVIATPRRSTSSLEAMIRSRVASILILSWLVIQVTSLLKLGFGPFRHPIGWVLVLIFLAMSAGLYQASTCRWARVSFLIIGSSFVVFYAYAYFLWKPPCTETFGGCDTSWIFLQPLLVLATLIVLFKPLSSNLRLSGP
jgi:hypothetical protein